MGDMKVANREGRKLGVCVRNDIERDGGPRYSIVWHAELFEVVVKQEASTSPQISIFLFMGIEKFFLLQACARHLAPVHRNWRDLLLRMQEIAAGKGCGDHEREAPVRNHSGHNLGSGICDCISITLQRWFAFSGQSPIQVHRLQFQRAFLHLHGPVAGPYSDRQRLVRHPSPQRRQDCWGEALYWLLISQMSLFGIPVCRRLLGLRHVLISRAALGLDRGVQAEPGLSHCKQVWWSMMSYSNYGDSDGRHSASAQQVRLRFLWEANLMQFACPWLWRRTTAHYWSLLKSGAFAFVRF
jgi:hypothetical protein